MEMEDFADAGSGWAVDGIPNGGAMSLLDLGAKTDSVNHIGQTDPLK